MTPAVDLKPCPFCEGPPVPIAVRGIGGGVFPDQEMTGEDGLFISTYVFCHECGAQGPEHSGIVFGPDDRDALVARAVRDWNERNARHRHLFDSGAREGLNTWPRRPR